MASAATGDRALSGFYCSTSGTYFSDKDALAEHYKSDFHRYNLKRKVAGLPPVTKEWFEARKAQLASAAPAAAAQRSWLDPLTGKRFASENTYQAFVRSKKYGELVRKSGAPAPEPVIVVRREAEEERANNAAGSGTSAAPPASAAAKPAGFVVRPPPGGLPGHERAGASNNQRESGSEEASEEAAAGEGSDWETASEDGDGEEWEEWDVCASLFDTHKSADMTANLEYMWKKYGFYIPDAEYCTDPAGLLRYLGAKLRYGKVPLYASGEDATAKTFRSLHAVQRHMVDTGCCKLLYDGNEDEYAEYYDYSAANEAQEGALALTEAPGAAAAVGGYELVVGGADGGAKILGSRDLARYYRQRPRPEDGRASVAMAGMVARYQALGVSTVQSRDPDTVAAKAAAHKAALREKRSDLGLLLKSTVNRNLPKNVPY